MPYYGFNAWPECPQAGAEFEYGLICNSSVQVRRLQIDNVNPSSLDFQVLQLVSAAGNGTIGFLPKEIYGWVVPVVNTHAYKTSFLSLSDWQSMRIRYSEPEYVIPGEWMELSFNYSNYRYAFTVTYSDTSAVIPAFPDQSYALLPTQRFGTSRINSINKSFDVILATGSGVDLSLPSFPGPYSLNVVPVQCAPNNPVCAFVADTPLQYPPLLWSAPSTWPNNVLPTCGDDVIVPPGRIIQLDVNPCALNSVLIYGKLQFLDDGDKVFEAKSITVFGYLEVGLPAQPFTHKAQIIIDGVLSDPTVIVSNSMFLGNKVMAVFGEVNLWGNVRVVPWTKLAATALPGDRTLQLLQPVDWVAGDAIVITTTEYEASQTENLTVASVSSDGRTVNLTTPLSFRHFSGQIDDGNGNLLSLAAAVGVMNRNIIIQSGLSGPTDVYGAHVYVGDVSYSTGQTRVGSFSANGVEFLSTGKQGMQYPSVWFSYTTLGSNPATWPTNVINGSSFFSSLNMGVISTGSKGINITNNVFHRTYGMCIDVDQATLSITVTGNLVAGNFRSPTSPYDWVLPFAGFYMYTNSVAALQDNVVGGTQDTGFVIMAETCGVANPAIMNNEVHGALIGGWILSASSGCLQLINFLAWKCAHIGVLTVDQFSNVQLNNVTVADSHIGVSLSFLQNGNQGRADIIGSRIYGSTAASTCSDSLTCRAMTQRDTFGTTCGSVFGTSYRRVGLIVPQYLNRAKTCVIDGGLPVCRPPTTPERLCSLPWELRYGLPGDSIHGELYVTNTVFGYFQAQDCGLQSVAVALNPTQIEYTPQLFFSGITWTAANVSARLSLGLTPQFSSTCQVSCDSLNFIMLTDLDGSLYPESGSRGGVMVSQEDPTLAYSYPTCVEQSEFGGIYCPGHSFYGAMLENKDLDRGSRFVGPIVVTKYSDNPDNRTTFSHGPYNDECAKRFFFGQYPFALEPGYVYDVIPSGVMPSNSRVQFFSKSPSDSALLRIFFTHPYAVAVINNGVTIPMSTSHPTLASPRGAHVLDPQERLFYLLVRGSSVPEEQIYDLVTLSIVQLSLTLSISNVAFFGPTLVNNMAILLQIPASRIKIVDVHNLGSRRRLLTTNSNSSGSGGSVSVMVEILPPVNDTLIAGNSTAQQENQQAQMALTTKITNLAQSGQLKATLAASGITLSTMAITPPPSVGVASSSAFVVSVNAPSSSSKGNSDGISLIALIAGTTSAAVVVIVVVFVYIAKKQRIFTFRGISSSVSPIISISTQSSSNSLLMNSQASSSSVIFVNARSSAFLENENTRNLLSETSFDSKVGDQSISRNSDSSSFNLSAKDMLHTTNSQTQYVVSSTVFNPVGESWVRPDLSRDDATKLLRSQRPGTFVVYGQGCAVLAVRCDHVIKHFPVVRMESSPPRFRLGLDESQPWHLSVASLIEYYQTARAKVPFVLTKEPLMLRPKRKNLSVEPKLLVEDANVTC